MAITWGMVGCGDNTSEPVPVAGVVTIDGAPLDGGTIQFVPKVGRPASSKVLADGSFDLASESVNTVATSGVLPGVYRVQVSSSEIIDDQTIRWKIPQRYADFRTSGLQVTISGPTDGLLIELESDKESDSGTDATDADTVPEEAAESEDSKS
jgi:hypothetical protein